MLTHKKKTHRAHLVHNLFDLLVHFLRGCITIHFVTWETTLVLWKSKLTDLVSNIEWITSSFADVGLGHTRGKKRNLLIHSVLLHHLINNLGHSTKVIRSPCGVIAD